MLTAVLLNDTSGENHIGSTQVVENIVINARKHNIHIAAKFRRQDVMQSNMVLIDAMKRCDFILINGEGTFHHSPKWISGLLGQFLVKPVVVINAVWDTMCVERSLLSKVSLIFVRETKSFNQLITIYPQDRVKVVPDMLFASLKTIKQHQEASIGYCDSVLEYVRMLSEVKDNYFPLETKTTQPDFYAYIAWLSGLKLYITGRFHGICLAAMCGIPFLSFPSNCHKNEALLEDMGCGDRLIRSFEEIPTKPELGETGARAIENYVNSAEEKIDNMFREIAIKMKYVKEGSL